MLYLCKRIDKKGFINECFYREGTSSEDIKEGLEMFCWPNPGEWVVSDPNEGEEEEYIW